MFRQISNFWRYIKYFINTKKIWCWPRQSDVLIYDVCDYETLFSYLKSWDPEFLHVRNEFINMPVLLVSIFRRGKMVDAYIDCYIEKVRPKLVVTFIDNNMNFYTISQRHPSLKTMFIQNGTRGYYADIFELLDTVSTETHDAMTVDYIMTFGSNVGAAYSRYIQGKVIPMGSIKNNHVPNMDIRETNVITFVSQWRKNGFFMHGKFYSHESFFRKPDQLIIQSLIKYSHKNNKLLKIILVNHKNSSDRAAEETYFRELVGGDVSFSDLTGGYPTYRAVDAAGVVVGVDSTVLYESIARGTKTAIFSIRSKLLGINIGFNFGWPSEYANNGPFWTNHPDPESFERILDHLFEIDDAQWCAELAEHSYNKLMICDPGNSLLKSILTKELGTMAN